MAPTALTLSRELTPPSWPGKPPEHTGTIRLDGLTPDEGNMIGALIERRANLLQTVELQDEIAALKAKIAGLIVTPPRPALHVVERASPR